MVVKDIGSSQGESVTLVAGEPAGRPECSREIFTELPGCEFEVGEATSKDEVRKRASGKGSLMDILES